MKIVFMGTPEAAVPSLRRLVQDGHEIVGVYTQPDRPAGRGNKIVPSPVKQLASERHLKILQPLKIRTAEALDEFKGLKADVAVVVAYGRILPESFLDAFPLGAVNLHFSLLPKYRGAAPVNWAIVSGETETGVTTMSMDAGLDTGPILMQRSMSISTRETAPELTERLADAGAALLSETLVLWDSLSPRAQDGSAATLAPVLKREDGLINWLKDAREIVNFVRGFQPFPTAFSYFGDKRLTIWQASVAESVNTGNGPGTVIQASGDELLIACSSGSCLKVEELQIEGKRRMSTRDFLNGIRLAEGTVLAKV